MKRTTKPVVFYAIVAACAFTYHSSTHAQETERKDRDPSASAEINLNKDDAKGSSSQSSESKQGSSSQQSGQQGKSGDQSSSIARQVPKEQIQNQVSSINKASSLIGMKVMNLQNENLGKIEDVVFDFQSGKVSYAVLSAGGFLGINEKYIAIPLSAFEPARGDDHLVLNANKERVNNAPGFAKNSYPNLNSPMWGSEAGLGKTSDPQAPKGTQSFTGKISSFNKEERKLTLKGESGTKEFSLDTNPKIQLGGQSSASLDDLTEGRQVTVHYKQAGEDMQAQSITEAQSSQSEAAGTSGSKTSESESGSSEKSESKKSESANESENKSESK